MRPRSTNYLLTEPKSKGLTNREESVHQKDGSRLIRQKSRDDSSDESIEVSEVQREPYFRFEEIDGGR